jgi:hypothetical protein
MPSTGCVHTIKLKNRLLAYFPAMHAQQCGIHVLLVFDAHTGNAISVACQQSYNENAIYMAQVAEIVRCDLFTSRVRFT